MTHLSVTSREWQPKFARFPSRDSVVACGGDGRGR